MRIAPSTLFAVAALLVPVAGCTGSLGDMPTGGTPRSRSLPPGTVCPYDPDDFTRPAGSLYECPDFWTCETIEAEGIKRCSNPGPDYPDQGTWDCADEGGHTVCRGDHFPDGGGGAEWSCERSGEFVVCTDNTPNYPDAQGDGPWACYFSGEFRVCEESTGSGDGGGWTCFDTATGRECRQTTPDYPDDRGWNCYDTATGTVCEAPGDFPDGGGSGEWDCVRSTEGLILCTDNTPDYPDGGGDLPWECHYETEFRVCSTGGGGGDGGGGVCVAGVQRWCDDAVYCSWGKQTCNPDGTWGPCTEPTVTSTGLTDRPDTECGCRYFYFNAACCEDQADRDGDGHADCIIPATHTAPACASTGGVCSYCDAHSDCGGPDDYCLFARDGYAFCSQDCSRSGCPSGYACQAIGVPGGVIQQCVPTAGTCG